jgi:hypothetical protein
MRAICKARARVGEAVDGIAQRLERAPHGGQPVAQRRGRGRPRGSSGRGVRGGAPQLEQRVIQVRGGRLDVAGDARAAGLAEQIAEQRLDLARAG